jgi:hypothetical protein
MAVVPHDDDEDRGQRNSDDKEREPHRAQTPPTPPVQHEASESPLPSPRPMRQRAMAQLRPVSIPNIVCDIAGPVPDGQPADESSSRGNSDAHRSELKKNADGLSRSFCLPDTWHCVTGLGGGQTALKHNHECISNYDTYMFYIHYIHYDFYVNPAGL